MLLYIKKRVSHILFQLPCHSYLVNVEIVTIQLKFTADIPKRACKKLAKFVLKYLIKFPLKQQIKAAMTATMIAVNMRPTQAVTTISGAVCIEKAYVNQCGFCSMHHTLATSLMHSCCCHRYM